MSYVYKDYGDVRIISEDIYLRVMRYIECNDMGWTEVRTFNEMSDDYAITNARNYAEELVAKMKGELV